MVHVRTLAGRSVPALAVVLCLAGPGVRPTRADEPAKSFRSVLEATSRTQMRAVDDYLKSHPDADDAEAGYRWLFETATTRGLEGEAAAAATRWLEHDEPDNEIARAALAVRSVARVRHGEFADGLADFRGVLDRTRLRTPDIAVSAAERLAVELQLAGKPKFAREVYEAVSLRFGLLPELRRRMENRIEKLALVGEQPPKLGLDDLEGKPVDLADHAGKVVVVDFWGTFCGPCIEMLPLMRRLHAEHAAEGLEIVGVSLDENADVVRDFAEKQRMPWRLALDDREASFAFKAVTIPSLYVIGRDGKVAYVDVRDDALERAVTGLLKQEKDE